MPRSRQLRAAVVVESPPLRLQRLRVGVAAREPRSQQLRVVGAARAQSLQLRVGIVDMPRPRPRVGVVARAPQSQRLRVVGVVERTRLSPLSTIVVVVTRDRIRQ